jgi:hypothetical protein
MTHTKLPCALLLTCSVFLSLPARASDTNDLNAPLDALESSIKSVEESSDSLDAKISTLHKSGAAPSIMDQRRLERLSRRLERASDRLEDITEDRDFIRHWFHPRCRLTSNAPEATQDPCAVEHADRETRRRAQWAYFGLTFRGPTSPSPNFGEQFGAEAGVRLPWHHAIDLGIGAGNLFREHGKVIYDARSRLYLNHYAEGLYLGLNAFLPPNPQGYLSLGLQGDNLYAELDFLRGTSRPVRVLVQFGLKVAVTFF